MNLSDTKLNDLNRCKLGKISDEELFKQPPLEEDCPICFVRLPSLGTGSKYMSCCGKIICSGCIHAPLYDNQGNKVDNKKCAFCRTPTPSSEKEMINRYKKRVEMNDPIAVYSLGYYYSEGKYGFSRDYKKALELWHRAAELGFAKAYNSIGYVYNYGQGVEVDKKKAVHYFELAAMGGDVMARNNLGTWEKREGNMERALKHFMIAIRGGNTKSLNAIKALCLTGNATKDDYTKALRSYQSYLGEIKSDQRDEAAAARENYRYY